MPDRVQQGRERPPSLQSEHYSKSALAILDAAEELFSSRGYSAVSMREIAKTSGQHLASANYYFGSKQGLFEATFLRRIVPVNRHRVELLEAFRRQGREDLDDVIEAYLRPLFAGKAADDGRSARLIMMFSKQLLSNPGEHGYLQEAYDEVAQQFIAAIHRARPALDVATVVWGYTYMIGILVFTLAGQEVAARVPAQHLVQVAQDRNPDQTIDRLKRFVRAGFDGLS